MKTLALFFVLVLGSRCRARAYDDTGALDQSTFFTALQEQYSGSTNELDSEQQLVSAPKRYHIRGQGSDRCVTGHGNTIDNGEQIVIYDCMDQGNEWWMLQSIEGTNFVQLVVQNSGKCMVVENAETNNDAAVIQWDCPVKSQGNAQWEILKSDFQNTQIRNPGSGRCLTVYGAVTYNEAHLIIYDCILQPNQIWNVEEDDADNTRPVNYHIRGLGSNRCATGHGNTNNNGEAIVLYDCMDQGNEWWTLRSIEGTNYVQLVVQNSMKCMVVQNADTNNEGSVIQWDCPEPSQGNAQWEILHSDWGNTQLRNPASGRCLTVHGAETENEAYLVIYDCIIQPNQVWSLETN